MGGVNANFRIRDLAFHAEATALTGNGNIAGAPEPIPAGYGDLTAPANSISWRNIPYASFRVFVFSSEAETDPANAVASSAVIAPLANDFWSAANTTQNARVVFDVGTLNLPAGNFWLRVQALSEQGNPINNLTPARNWGESSPISAEFAQITIAAPVAAADILDVYDEEEYAVLPEEDVTLTPPPAEDADASVDGEDATLPVPEEDVQADVTDSEDAALPPTEEDAEVDADGEVGDKANEAE